MSQGDKTGDTPLPDLLKLYLKEKYKKPGDVFLGVVHRLDRPVGGVMVFARTSKALERLNEAFRAGTAHKTYLAVTTGNPTPESGELRNLLSRNEKLNKSFVTDIPSAHTKEAVLRYAFKGNSERYSLLEIELLTGRHHQIRAQLAHIGCIIKGDLKYGAKRSNPDGSLSLLAWKLSFPHPTTKEMLSFSAPLPDVQPWIELGKYI